MKKIVVISSIVICLVLCLCFLVYNGVVSDFLVNNDNYEVASVVLEIRYETTKDDNALKDLCNCLYYLAQKTGETDDYKSAENYYEVLYNNKSFDSMYYVEYLNILANTYNVEKYKIVFEEFLDLKDNIQFVCESLKILYSRGDEDTKEWIKKQIHFITNSDDYIIAYSQEDYDSIRNAFEGIVK